MAYGDHPLDAPCKPNKGKEGGACNRRACQAEPADWYNHGSYAWYCGDCRDAIGGDPVNLRHWQARWQPECGHPQFETREQMDAREAAKLKPEPLSFESIFGDRAFYNTFAGSFPTKPKSASLERILRKAR